MNLEEIALWEEVFEIFEGSIRSLDPTGLFAYDDKGNQVSTLKEPEKPEKPKKEESTTNKPQINYKNFFGFLKTCIENSIVQGSNAMSTTWELFMFPQPHLQAILQKELDAYLGFYSSKGTSQSCKTVSLVMHYAVLGYSHDFLKKN